MKHWFNEDKSIKLYNGNYLEVRNNLIKPYTNEGGLVLDLTMGNGTTIVVCAKLNHNFIGIELEEKYFDISIKRIKEATL